MALWKAVSVFLLLNDPFELFVAGVVGMNENSTKGSTAGLGFINLRETTIDINPYKSSNHYRTICTP